MTRVSYYLTACVLFVAISSFFIAPEAWGSAGSHPLDGTVTGFIKHYMAPIMFFALVLFLLVGYPVAFALAANGIVFWLIGIKLGLLNVNLFSALPQRMWAIMSNDTLLAIPFFTFMGLVLERSGMAEDLLDTVGKLFGPVRGGLAYAVIFVGALLAATTGVVAASVIAMGLISLPIMLRYGYDRALASGTIAASGTLAQIIPPSLVLIVLADQLGRSVGDMYQGAFVPGFILTGFYMLYILLMSIMYPNKLPAIPPEARSFGKNAPYKQVMLSAIIPLFLLVWGMWILFAPESGLLPFLKIANMMDPAGVALLNTPESLQALSGATGMDVALKKIEILSQAQQHGLLATLYNETWGSILGVALIVMGYYFYVATLTVRDRAVGTAITKIIKSLVPPLLLIFLVLGTIFRGIATPTEGGAMGAVGAIILAAINGRLNWGLIRQATEKTAKLATFVVFILIGARVFSLTFYGVDGHIWVEELLLSLPGGQTGFLIVVNTMVFLLAFFLDFFELAFIVVPLLAPIAEKLGIDLIWFGVMLGVNMQTSFMHPPFGFALFYLRSVAPTEDYKDKITGENITKVSTGEIYMGAIPYVVIQVIMVGLVIAFPSIVSYNKQVKVDTTNVKIEIPQSDYGLPEMDAPVFNKR